MLTRNGTGEASDTSELSEAITVPLTRRELECIARLAELRGRSLEDMTRELLSLSPRNGAGGASASEPAK